MKITNLLRIVFCLTFFTISLEAQTSGVLFTVNNNADSADATPGDRICADSLGQCTLRAAIQEANGNTASGDVIIFAMPWPAVINLTIGELAITARNLSIVGPGARRLAIRRSYVPGTPEFRIFHIPNADTNTVIRGFAIENGRAVNGLVGGGIKLALGSTLSLTEMFFIENVASNGGAIANDGTLNITRSLIDSNSAVTNGAALINSAGSSARITNSTITGGAALSGGAIHNNGALLLVNNTISHNFAVNTASSVLSGSTGSVNILNTIIASDISPTAASIQGTFISMGNNLITDARESSGFTNGVNNDQVSNGNAINPLLGNLSDNGGQTDTRALLTGSPAINAGNNCVWNGNCVLPPGPPLRFFWDQRRGYLRGGIFDAVDVGAYELSSSTSSSGSIFGSFNPGPAGRLLNSIVIFTDVATNEKTYRVINPFGRFRSPQFGNEVYVLEYRTKRQPSIAPSVLALPD